MSSEIYYFSGTGNSLQIARLLANRLPECKIVPIVGLLGQESVKSSSATVGIVFPVHALSVPLAVVRFLRKIDLSSVKYLFAVATRLGIIFDGFTKIDRLLQRQDKRLQAQFTLNMPSNDSKDEKFRELNMEEFKALEDQTNGKLDVIEKVIAAQGLCLEPDNGYLNNLSDSSTKRYLIQQLVPSLLSLSEHTGGVNYFYTDQKCNGCRTCAKVCLSEKIRMVGSKPTWTKERLCYMCYACVNFCPREAIQIRSIPGVKSYTEKNPRYSHPYARIADIEGEKQHRN